MSQNFGCFLKEKRLEKNLTQKQLASFLFVSESAISKWEKGVSYPDITLLPKLSKILGVSEHELITSSVDNSARQEKIQAKKWRNLAFSWNLFFYIAYALTIIPCFICNLAIEKTLSWFWIVVSALVLSFTFTNLPSLIKKNKLLLLPLASYLALCLLLGVCCIYTGGAWFFVASISVLFGLIIVFLPIYIAKFNLFNKVKRFNDFISVGIDFILLNVLLVVINLFTLSNTNWWYFSLALPIASSVYLALNVLLCVRFIKTNKLVKTGLVIFLTNVFLFLPPLFIKVKNPAIQTEIDDFNVFRASLSKWNTDTVDNNVSLIICLALLILTAVFLTAGILKNRKK